MRPVLITALMKKTGTISSHFHFNKQLLVNQLMHLLSIASRLPISPNSVSIVPGINYLLLGAGIRGQKGAGSTENRTLRNYVLGNSLQAAGSTYVTKDSWFIVKIVVCKFHVSLGVF